MKDKKINNSLEGLKFISSNAVYWMMMCSLTGFLSVFLSGRNISAKNIGIISAISNIAGAFLQPIFTKRLDKNKESERKYIIILSAITISFMIFSIFFSNNKLFTGFLFVFYVSIFLSLQPLLNTLSIHHMKKNKKISYGVARGTGAFSYAIMSIILGRISIINSEFILYISILLMIIFMFFMFLQKPIQGEKDEINEELKIQRDEKGLISLYFCVILIFTFYNITTIYLYQILQNVGGNSSDMGIIFAVAAGFEVPMMLYIDKMIEKFSYTKLLVFSSFMFFVKGLLIISAKSVGFLIAIQFVQALSFGIFTPIVVYYVKDLSSFKNIAKNQGYLGASMTTGAVLGSLVGGFLIEYMDVYKVLFASNIFAVLGIFFAIISVNRSKKNI